MEHPRCAQCRNPIRGRQTFIRLASAGMSFHDDCWVELHALVQNTYQSEYAEVGVPALLKPYHRDQLAAWLPGLEADDPADVTEVEPEAAPVSEPEPTRTAIALGPVVERAPEVPVLAEPDLEVAVAEEWTADEPVEAEPPLEELVVGEPVVEEPVEEPVAHEPSVEEPVRVARAAEAKEVTVVHTRATKPSRGDRARAFAGKARGTRRAGSEHTSAAS